jgi:hypothetical protein
MSEEQFINLINLVKKEDDKLDEIYKVIGGKMFEIIIKTYMSIDAFDWIEWWLYEDVKKIITIENKPIDVTEIKDFYKFLKNNY